MVQSTATLSCFAQGSIGPDQDVEMNIATGQMRFCFAALLLIVGVQTASSSTMSFTEAIGKLATACGADVSKHCKGVELGGGKLRACFDAKRAVISAQCQQTRTEVYSSISRRVAAQNNSLQICSADIARRCPGVAAGDGNVLSCVLAVAPQLISAACNQALDDTGWRTERV
jgi:hypothetical protein